MITGLPQAQSVISLSNILCFLFNKCFDHPCTSLVNLTLVNHTNVFKTF